MRRGGDILQFAGPLLEGLQKLGHEDPSSTNASFRAFLMVGDNLRSSCRETLAGIWSSCFTMSKRTGLAVLAALSLTIGLEKRGSGRLSSALAGLAGGVEQKVR